MKNPTLGAAVAGLVLMFGLSACTNPTTRHSARSAAG